MELNQALLTAFIGLITGAIGSLITPYVKWGIEKKRKRHDYRREIIKELKSIAMKSDFDRIQIINAQSYMSVREKLSYKTIKTLERPLSELRGTVGDPALDSDKQLFIIDLAALEKKWGIV